MDPCIHIKKWGKWSQTLTHNTQSFLGRHSPQMLLNLTVPLLSPSSLPSTPYFLLLPLPHLLLYFLYFSPSSTLNFYLFFFKHFETRCDIAKKLAFSYWSRCLHLTASFLLQTGFCRAPGKQNLAAGPERGVILEELLFTF